MADVCCAESVALKAENEGLSVQLYEATEDLAGCQSACAVIDKRFLDAQAEVKRLRDAFTEMQGWAEGAGLMNSQDAGYVVTVSGVVDRCGAALEGGGNGE